MRARLVLTLVVVLGLPPRLAAQLPLCSSFSFGPLNSNSVLIPDCEIGGLTFQGGGTGYFDLWYANNPPPLRTGIYPSIDVTWTQVGHQVTMTLSSALGALVSAQTIGNGSGPAWASSQFQMDFGAFASSGLHILSVAAEYNNLNLIATGASTVSFGGVGFQHQNQVPTSPEQLFTGQTNQFVASTFMGAFAPVSGTETATAELSGSWSFEFTVAPEPSTWALMATGLLGLGMVAWRRRGRA